jgi:hypothetical protein
MGNYIAQSVQIPFQEAGLKGLKPPAPIQVSQNFLDIGDFKDFQWPTLSKLNDELDSYPFWNEDKQHQFMTNDPLFLPPVMYHGPPQLPLPTPTDSLLPPSITTLAS